MKKLVIHTFMLVSAGLLLQSCNQGENSVTRTDGPEVVSFRAVPFDLTDVKLLDGPFKRATELNVKSLLNYEPDRFLAKFRIQAGLKPKAANYHGWEDESLAGHSLGHYLSACALMYQTTGNKEFLQRVNYIVDELDTCQKVDGEGYISAFPDGKRIFEEEVAKGNIRSAGFDLNGIWSPFYTYHKILAGLRDAYHLCGNKKALEIEKNFANWIEGIVADLPDSSVQKMLRCEYGGMNEVLAELYGDTKDERYLKDSRIFYDKAVLDSLLLGIDVLPGKHANTQIPKLIGLASLYELTGDKGDRATAEFFWNRVVNHHSYVTGGNCNNEYFGQPDKLRNRLGPNTTETCNVYNMLKLSRHLFMWDASPEVADFYERALFNHILASQNPVDGRVVYNLSLDMGGIKEFQDPGWFTCCIGTGMENHSKYGANIYFHNKKELFITQFIGSELTWKAKGLVVRQETNYPEEHGTTITFAAEKPLKLSLQIRYPYWAGNDIDIKINGRSRRVKQQPGSFVAIYRNWKDGDKVEIKIPFSLRLESMPDDSNRVAIMYGPLVLGGELGPEEDPNVNDPLYVPVLMTGDRNPADWTEPVGGMANKFETDGIGKPRDIKLEPFYKIYDKHYSIYLDMFSEADWEKREADYQAHLAHVKTLKELTIDFAQPGEMQPEREHNFKGEKTSTGFFKERSLRESRSGWFSFDMKVLPDKPVALVVDYWGGFPGAKTFDILVNDQVIKTENISGKKDGQFIDIQYTVPENLTLGRKKISVKFMAHPHNMAGPVFGIRTIRL